MDLERWRGRPVLVTGHTGFKGAWLSWWLLERGAEVSGLALPPDDPRSTFEALGPWPSLRSHLGDLRDDGFVRSVLATERPEVVFHLAAQPLVRAGIARPAETFGVNVEGTVRLLDAIADCPSVRAVVVVTSDKVYRQPGPGRPFREDDALGGHDPYSASKACVEMVVDSWRASSRARADCAIATARAGNVIGGGDRGRDRLLPDALAALESGATLRLRYPGAVRPWQHVLEPLRGYLALAEALDLDPSSAPAAVNFGPAERDARSVATVVERLFELWGSGQWEQEPVDQPHEAESLRLDASLAAEALGWAPALDLDRALSWTVAWWQAQHRGDDLRTFSTNQIKEYEALL